MRCGDNVLCTEMPFCYVEQTMTSIETVVNNGKHTEESELFTNHWNDFSSPQNAHSVRENYSK